jgi:hypothetical protein
MVKYIGCGNECVLFISFTVAGNEIYIRGGIDRDELA